MDGKSAKQRACNECKVHKIKCSRSLPACRQCLAANRECVYPAATSVRFRDETSLASSRAIKKWRARSVKQACHVATDLRSPVALSVPYLARHRFLYDFAGTSNAPFVGGLHDLIFEWAIAGDTDGVRDSLNLSLDAVALVSFSRRQNDSRAANEATQLHGLALAKLREDLEDTERSPSTRYAFAAVLLGLYQNIRRDPHTMTGSWMLHFRGAITMLLKVGPNVAQSNELCRLITKQALHISFRIGKAIRPPSQLLAWHEAQMDSLGVKVMTMAYWTIDFCDKDERVQSARFRISEDRLSEAAVIEESLDALEVELRREVPYVSEEYAPKAYAPWYWPISTQPGSPASLHMYQNLPAAARWNIYRMARLELLTWLLTAAEYTPKAEKLDKALQCVTQLVEDMCACVYYFLQYTGDGRPPPVCFEGVPSSAAYSLISMLLNVRFCLMETPALPAEVRQLKIGWIEKVVCIFSEKLAITEAPCWKEGNILERQAALARLQYGNPSPSVSEAGDS